MTSAHDHSALPTVEVRHRLRIAREWAGLDQEQLAERMEVVRATVSNAETGRSNPSRKTVRDWALACGVPREWILTGEHPDSGPEPSSGLGIKSPLLFRVSYGGRYSIVTQPGTGPDGPPHPGAEHPAPACTPA